MRHTKLWKKVPKLNLEFRKLNTEQAVTNPVNDPTESANLDQLCEPWLEDLLYSPPTVAFELYILKCLHSMTINEQLIITHSSF